MAIRVSAVRQVSLGFQGSVDILAQVVSRVIQGHLDFLASRAFPVTADSLEYQDIPASLVRADTAGSAALAVYLVSLAYLVLVGSLACLDTADHPASQVSAEYRVIPDHQDFRDSQARLVIQGFQA